MGKSKACENSTLLFFVIAFFLRIFLARMYCSSAIACLDWTRTPFFFLVWTKILFFFSRFLLILLSATKKKESSWIEEQASTSSGIVCLDWARIPFFSLFETKIPFFFLVCYWYCCPKQKKTEWTTCSFCCSFLISNRKTFFFFDKSPVPGGLGEKNCLTWFQGELFRFWST